MGRVPVFNAMIERVKGDGIGSLVAWHPNMERQTLAAAQQRDPCSAVSQAVCVRPCAGEGGGVKKGSFHGGTEMLQFVVDHARCSDAASACSIVRHESLRCPAMRCRSSGRRTKNGASSVSTAWRHLLTGRFSRGGLDGIRQIESGLALQLIHDLAQRLNEFLMLGHQQHANNPDNGD